MSTGQQIELVILCIESDHCLQQAIAEPVTLYLDWRVSSKCFRSRRSVSRYSIM